MTIKRTPAVFATGAALCLLGLACCDRHDADGDLHDRGAPHANGHAPRRRRHKAGDLADLRRMLWQALIEAKRVLLESSDAELTLRAVHAVSQAAGQYMKLLEIGELEARVAALEASAARAETLAAR